VIGVIPGIGGLVGLSLLLPFTYNMDPYATPASANAAPVSDKASRALLIVVPSFLNG